MRLCLIPAVCTILLAACSPTATTPPSAESPPEEIVTGGHCEYVSETVSGHLLGADGQRIYFGDSERESQDVAFSVVFSDFTALAYYPPGTHVTFNRQRIVSGTCVPERYDLVDIEAPAP